MGSCHLALLTGAVPLPALCGSATHPVKGRAGLVVAGLFGEQFELQG